MFIIKGALSLGVILGGVILSQRPPYWFIHFKFRLFFPNKATDTATRKTEQASKKQVEVEQSKKVITIEKVEAEEVLKQALPALEAARTALSNLDKNDITEIRSFATPPAAVQTVCEGIVIIKGLKELSWASAKSMMSEGGFLKSLMEMNCDAITQKQVTKCRNHLKVRTTVSFVTFIGISGSPLLLNFLIYLKPAESPYFPILTLKN